MATKYKLNVKNDSRQTGHVCVYQTHPDQDRLNLFSLAWFSEICAPGVEISFDWTIDYSVIWSQVGTLKPGIHFKASQKLPADPMDVNANLQILSKKTGALAFNNDYSEEGEKGLITIKADHTIPNDKISIGVGMGGEPAIALNTFANMEYYFSPHPVYWVVFGDFIKGKVIDLNKMSRNKHFEFGYNVTEKNLTFTEANVWV